MYLRPPWCFAFVSSSDRHYLGGILHGIQLRRVRVARLWYLKASTIIFIQGHSSPALRWVLRGARPRAPRRKKAARREPCCEFVYYFLFTFGTGSYGVTAWRRLARNGICQRGLYFFVHRQAMPAMHLPHAFHFEHAGRLSV